MFSPRILFSTLYGIGVIGGGFGVNGLIKSNSKLSPIKSNQNKERSEKPINKVKNDAQLISEIDKSKDNMDQKVLEICGISVWSGENINVGKQNDKGKSVSGYQSCYSQVMKKFTGASMDDVWKMNIGTK